MSTIEARLAALDARISALETARPSDAAAATADAAVPPGTFWALEGLHGRVPEPGAVMIVGDVVLPDGKTARWQQGMGTDDLLDDEWDRVAEVLAALGHPVRLQLLRHVLRGIDSARSLAEIEGIGTSGQVYHHLRQLVAAGWLRSRGGRYEVPPERVVPLLTTVLGGRR